MRLISIGFKKHNIKVLRNATKPQIDTALYNFVLQAESANIALVYFSGHGLQVGGTNYLMPTEVKARSHKDFDNWGSKGNEYRIRYVRGGQ